MVHTADRSKAALALSGGGFRATLFHIGAICRLNELGLLSGLERISSVSGGSIAAGRLANRWTHLTRDNDRFTNLESEVVQPLRTFCKGRVDERAIAVGTLSPFSTIGEKLTEIYADELVGAMTVQDLPDKPQFVFNATNLQTGRLVRIQKVRMADYSIGEIRNPRVPLAQAMAASSAFPPVLSPVKVQCNPADWVGLQGAVHFGDARFCQELSLTDGGAYDNLGLETVSDFATIFVSDAGAPFSVDTEAHGALAKQTMRALDIATDQARMLRRRLLYAETVVHNAQPDGSKRRFALAAIGDDLADTDTGKRLSAPRVLAVDPAVVASLGKLRTRLNPFSDEEQGRLINWGWYLMDLAVRARIAINAPAPETWFVPEHPLG